MALDDLFSISKNNIGVHPKKHESRKTRGDTKS